MTKAAITLVKPVTVDMTRLATQLTWWASILITLRTLGVRLGVRAESAWETYNSVDNLAASALQTILNTIC